MRFIPLIILVALSAAAFYFVDAQHSLTGRPTIDMLLGLVALNLLVYLWIRLVSGFSAKTQGRTIGALILLQVAFFATVQLEGIYGNGRPVLEWRWNSRQANQFDNRTSSESNLVSVELPASATWPQFRGPNRDGNSAVQLEDWNERPPTELWRQSIGAGWSSFAVAGEYCFTMEQRGHDECVTCYKLNTGQQLWVHRDAERFAEITGGQGPRSTPTFDNRFLYTLGATGILNCLDATNGDRLWSVDILATHEAMNCYYGMCGSPLVVGDLVIVNPGGKGASLAAYNKRNGDLVWTGGDAESSYASPQLMRLCGIDQVLNFNADGLTSHHSKNGNVLWEIPWISNEAERNNVCQPIQVSDDRVFISSGYGQGSGLFQITKVSDSEFAVELIWQNKKLRSKFANAVFDGDHIYGLDLGILVCLNADTGQRQWKRGRYKHGQLLRCGEHLIVQSEDGYIAQVSAIPGQFVELSRLPALSRRTWNHPVVAGNYLLARNDREVVCYQLSKSASNVTRDNGSVEKEDLKKSRTGK